MRFEMELVKGGPLDEAAEGVVKLKTPTSPARKSIRETTDELLDRTGAITYARFAVSACETMFVIAAALLDHDRVPEVSDFFEALQALVEDSRAVIDRGLLLQDGATIRCGAVMMELTIRGAVAAIGLPYDDLMKTIRAGGDIGPILAAAGHPLPQENNDGDATAGAGQAGEGAGNDSGRINGAGPVGQPISGDDDRRA